MRCIIILLIVKDAIQFCAASFARSSIDFVFLQSIPSEKTVRYDWCLSSWCALIHGWRSIKEAAISTILFTEHPAVVAFSVISPATAAREQTGASIRIVIYHSNFALYSNH